MSSTVNAYRVGDAVDTVIWLPGGETTDAMRAHMPKFGVSTSVSLPPLKEKFSFGFEEGLWALPWTEAWNMRGEGLERLVVTFVYSKSGGGAIHSVSSESFYRSRGTKDKNKDGKKGDSQLKVQYKWLEEEPVNLQAGLAAMFFATLVASVVFLIQACGLTGDDDEVDSDNMSYGHDTISSPVEVKKWG